MSNQCFGIMDQGYFVSRKDIIKWINSNLNIQLNSIQQLGTGTIYCQLLDAFSPGKVPIHKVNFKAKHQYEFIQNFKIFQVGLDKLGISKKIDIQKISKCKYQDNLELIQWLKRYIELEGGIKNKIKGSQQKINFYATQNLSKVLRQNNLNKQNFKKGSMIYSSPSSNFKNSENIHRSCTSLLKNVGRSNFKTPEHKPLSFRSNEIVNKFEQIRQIVTNCSDLKQVQSEIQKIRQVIHNRRIQQQQELQII